MKKKKKEKKERKREREKEKEKKKNRKRKRQRKRSHQYPSRVIQLRGSRRPHQLVVTDRYRKREKEISNC